MLSSISSLPRLLPCVCPDSSLSCSRGWMLWQWALLLTLTVWMPVSLLRRLVSSTTGSGSAPLPPSALSALYQRASYLSALVPLAVPVYIAARMNQTVRYYCRFGLYCTTLGLTSVWAIVLSVALNLVGRTESIQYYVARSFYYFASPIVGWKITIEGREHLRQSQSTVFVGNHQSMIDILYLARMFPKRTSVTAKRELKWSPFLGQLYVSDVRLPNSPTDCPSLSMWLSNTVFIDRKNAKDARDTFSRAVKDMKDREMSIWIFAEGVGRLIGSRGRANNDCVQEPAQIPRSRQCCRSRRAPSTWQSREDSR